MTKLAESPNGKAVEKHPSIEDVLGTNEKAGIYADMIHNVARARFGLRTQQLGNGDAETDKIPGGPGKTYAEQYKTAEDGIERLYREADEAGFRALLDEQLEAKKG